MAPRHPSPKLRSARGMSLIEGLVASAVLAIGMIGVFGGIVQASRQNASAAKLTWASSIADQVKHGIAIQGRGRLAGGGGFFAQSCATSAAVKALAGGLENVTGACVLDLDAYEDAVTDPTLQVVPGYARTVNQGLNPRPQFRRVVVRWANGLTNQDNVVVVVSFTSAGSRQFVKKFTAVFNNLNTGAETGLEL